MHVFIDFFPFLFNGFDFLDIHVRCSIGQISLLRSSQEHFDNPPTARKVGSIYFCSRSRLPFPPTTLFSRCYTMYIQLP